MLDAGSALVRLTVHSIELKRETRFTKNGDKATSTCFPEAIKLFFLRALESRSYVSVCSLIREESKSRADSIFSRQPCHKVPTLGMSGGEPVSAHITRCDEHGSIRLLYNINLNINWTQPKCPILTLLFIAGWMKPPCNFSPSYSPV